jgi:hypothetical protein
MTPEEREIYERGDRDGEARADRKWLTRIVIWIVSIITGSVGFFVSFLREIGNPPQQ